MKYLKKFNELKKETYISAADKLKNMGHKKRAKKLVAHSNRNKEIDRIDPNKYEIKFYNGVLKINDIYQITEATHTNTINDPIEPIDVIILETVASKIKIAISDKWFKKEGLWIGSGSTNGSHIGPYYDDEDEDKYYPDFKFINRKDAVNFRQFLIDEFGDKYKKVSINSLYE